VTALSNDERAEELMAELFAEDLDRNATGNDLRKLSINIDLRFDAVDRRFDEVDRRFNELRHDMNEGFNRIESRLTRGLINNIGWIIATNIAVFGTVIASLAFLANYLK
jgi:hypothetical protein